MAIFDILRARRARRRAAAHEPEPLLDNSIREALWEDQLASPPTNAWERLYKAVLDRRVLRSPVGMWVLNEPLRDPPESPPMLLGGRDFERARRLHNNWLYGINRGLSIETAWLSSGLAAIVNW